MVYLVPVYYELVEYVKVELPEETDIKIPSSKVMPSFKARIKVKKETANSAELFFVVT